jgi:hypothetical protein
MKKKVNINVSIASERFSYKTGDSPVIDAVLADKWIASGIASPAEEDADELKKQIAELQKRLATVEPDSRKKAA